jgi:hypothetical protein
MSGFERHLEKSVAAAELIHEVARLAGLTQPVEDD